MTEIIDARSEEQREPDSYEKGKVEKVKEQTGCTSKLLKRRINLHKKDDYECIKCDFILGEYEPFSRKLKLCKTKP